MSEQMSERAAGRRERDGEVESLKGEVEKCRISLCVLDFTVHFLSLLLPDALLRLAKSQIIAAREAYTHATGEAPWPRE